MHHENLTHAGEEAVKKMGVEAAENASAALSALIRQKVVVKTVEVRSVAIADLPLLVGLPNQQVVGLLMELSGDVFGEILLVYPKQSAMNMADFLSKRALGSTTVLDELDRSALKESGNIIAGAFLTTMSNYVHCNMVESVPELLEQTVQKMIRTAVMRFHENDMVEAIATEINFDMGASASRETTAIVETIETRGYFVLLFDGESSAKVMNALKDLSGGARMTKK
jgi:chemotaxis protein CheC